MNVQLNIRAHLNLSDRSQRIILIALCVSLTFLYRFFFYKTNVFYLDGDEAVVGLMGIDMLSGEFPLYFYGQTYGFSLVEVLLIALGISLFGTTVLAIKLPMLLLWCASLVLFVLTTHHLTKKNFVMSTIVMLVLITLPTWMVWSMKARGGYLTALLFSSLVIYLLVVSRYKSNNWFWGLIGVLLALIYEAQPLWFPTTLLSVILLPIINGVMPNKLVGKWGLALLTGSIIWLCLFIYKQDLFVVWTQPPLNFDHIIDDPLAFIKAINHHLHGLYYLYLSHAKTIAAHSLIIWLIALTVVGYSLYQVYFRCYKEALVILLLPASMVGVLINPNPRYLLPCSFVLFFLLVVSVARGSQSYQNFVIALLMSLLVANLWFVPNYTKFSQMHVESLDGISEPPVMDNPITDNQIIQNLILTLQAKGVKNVIVRNDLLEYQINYFTGYELLTIGKMSRTRQPKLIPLVSKAYLENPNQFAIVGFNWGYKLSKFYPSVNRKLIYWVNPDRESLKKIDLLPLTK